MAVGSLAFLASPTLSKGRLDASMPACSQLLGLQEGSLRLQLPSLAGVIAGRCHMAVDLLNLGVRGRLLVSTMPLSKRPTGGVGSILLLPLLTPGVAHSVLLTVSERLGALLCAVTGLSCQPNPPHT